MTSFLTLNDKTASKINLKLGQQTEQLSSSFERLSSGLRINRPSDDAAGLAIASNLEARSTVYNQALRNANDAISSLNVADGALSEMSNILGRLSELSSQSANGIYNLTQRKALDAEADQLVKEYNRIVSSVEFNNQSLLGANQSATRIQLGYGIDGSFSYFLGDDLDHAIGTDVYDQAINAGGLIVTTGAVADFNGDGKDDMVGHGNAIALFGINISNGDGTFSVSTLNMGGGNTAQTSIAGDFDGNGTIDLALSYTGTPGTKIYSNDGSGNFTLVSTLSTASANAVATDVNGDGKLDILSTSGSNVAVKLGNGDGTFQNQTTLLNTGSSISSLSVGDFNGDGKSDFVVSNSVNTNVAVYTNGGTGIYTNTDNLTAAAISSNFQIGDVNSDGYDDIIGMVGGTLYQSLSRSDGTTSTGLQSLGITSANNGSQLKDMNGDGILDILTKTSNTTIGVYTGIGDGTYDTDVRTTTIANGALAAGDYNGDGVMDVYVGKGGGSPSYQTHLAITANTTTIGRLYLLDQEGAREAIDTVDAIKDRVSKEQGKIGANLSRLQVSLSNVDSLRTNSAEAASRITDVDTAEEVTNMVRLQVLQNSSQALAAQANQNAQTVLQLLRF